MCHDIFKYSPVKLRKGATAHENLRTTGIDSRSRVEEGVTLGSCRISSLLFDNDLELLIAGLRSSCKNELAPAPELCFFITWHRLCFVNTL